MARQNFTVTVIAGTPINLATAMTSAQMLAAGYTYVPRKMINRILVQLLIGGTGAGYVMDGIRGVTSAAQQWRVPAATTSTDLTAQLAPASATAPGGSYSDSDNEHGIDISGCWVDGSHTGDTLQVSFDSRT